jgi:hypothetical protein
MARGPITDNMMQMLRYTKQQKCKITHWHLTQHEFNNLLDELYFWPHEKVNITNKMAHGEAFQTYCAKVKLIPSTSERP